MILSKSRAATVSPATDQVCASKLRLRFLKLGCNVLTSAERTVESQDDRSRIPDLEELLRKRDYTGAIVLLKIFAQAEDNNVRTLEWLAYCYFHFYEHDKVLLAIQHLVRKVMFDSILQHDHWIFLLRRPWPSTNGLYGQMIPSPCISHIVQLAATIWVATKEPRNLLYRQAIHLNIQHRSLIGCS